MLDHLINVGDCTSWAKLGLTDFVNLVLVSPAKVSDKIKSGNSSSSGTWAPFSPCSAVNFRAMEKKKKGACGSFSLFWFLWFGGLNEMRGHSEESDDTVVTWKLTSCVIKDEVQISLGAIWPTSSERSLIQRLCVYVPVNSCKLSLTCFKSKHEMSKHLEWPGNTLELYCMSIRKVVWTPGVVHLFWIKSCPCRRQHEITAEDTTWMDDMRERDRKIGTGFSKKR